MKRNQTLVMICTGISRELRAFISCSQYFEDVIVVVEYCEKVRWTRQAVTGEKGRSEHYGRENNTGEGGQKKL